MYTSGCPKNQNRCWDSTGSPPHREQKNDVFRFRSVNNIVIAAASTGKDRKRRNIVNKIDQINNGIRSSSIPVERILMIVEIKLVAPIIIIITYYYPIPALTLSQRSSFAVTCRLL